MFKNYLTVALRRFRRGGTHAILNVVGLAVGMATCSLIFLLVHHEWSYDRFHEEKERIHRVYFSYVSPEGEPGVQAMMAPDFTPELQTTFPAIEEATRFVAGSRDFVTGDETYRFRMAEIDPGFYRMFSFEVLAGDAAATIEDPGSVVITREVAEAMFQAQGEWNRALGQVISTSTNDATHDFNVGAVVEDFPENSSVSFQIGASFENYSTIRLGGNNWGGRTSTYVLLSGQTEEELEAAFPAFTDIAFGRYVESMRGAGNISEAEGSYSLQMQPLTDVHSDPDVWVPYEAGQHDPTYSYILLGIGALILLIACINFMTLSVGQSTIRAREVGVRKVLGANRVQIMRQHWGESVVAASIALLLGFGLALLLLPAFSGLAGVTVSISDVSPLMVLGALVFLVVIVGVVAGGYPAAVLSRYLPATVLKGSISSPSGGRLTQALVVLQFTISIGLIASTVVMTQQLQFMLDKDLGFDDEALIAVQTNQIPRSEKDGVLGRMRDQLMPYENITYLEKAGSTFTRGSDRNTWQDGNGVSRSAFNMGVGFEYLDVMGMELVAGRFFSAEFPGDLTNSIVVNEALVREFEIEEPIGHVMTNWLSFIYEESPTIIGVVKDFNWQSLRNEVEPLVMNMHPDYYNYMGTMLVRVRPNDVAGSLALIEDAWEQVLPGKPFSYSFVEDDLAGMYASDRRWQRIVSYSSILAIVIACMGLFGLAILAVGRRTKEIGIRKVLGASVPGVTGLLSREFAVMVLLASLLAVPMAWFAMSRWLEGFAFQIPLSPWIFIGATSLAMVVALGTVGFHSVRAARSNPVKALRYE